MFRTASEVLRSLEMRVARLEGRTAARPSLDVSVDAREYLKVFEKSDFSRMEDLSAADFNARDFKAKSVKKDKFGINYVISTLHPTGTIYYFVATYSPQGELLSVDGVYDLPNEAESARKDLM
jgi:hypothetical protein